MKYSFKNDYSEGCHPRILQALTDTNHEQQQGYGEDDFCNNAAALIKDECRSPNAEVYFVSGGTQANLIVISSILRPHESVISANTGHIFTNETAAVEATGHKVNHIDTENGKISVQQVQQVLDSHRNIPHQVKPRMVYISNSTEVGTLYSREELENLSEFCKVKDLYLFMDGARLGHALMAETNDLDLQKIAELTDVFYLGGTKNGALLGEAIVINRPELQQDFGFHIKQKGAMLAKGRLLGIQFRELLKNGLYFELAKHANMQAMKIKKAFTDLGFKMLSETYTNQIFPILKNHQIEQLASEFDFYTWKRMGETSAAIRLMTSWATQDSTVDRLVSAINSLK